MELRRPEPSTPGRNPASARAVLEPAAVEAEARRITALIRGEAKRSEGESCGDSWSGWDLARRKLGASGPRETTRRVARPASREAAGWDARY
ncbi:hypothetical protein PR202_ga09246 [Eleusine coracana subsp. coracana]|uniref:Uncharacterized protein n=1 Tax=Eleusine coracana subsp. coracana TaxID=191504 RepID=A0AAV5C3H1_ELECO|nr:hypothetical protein PR202_ga09246 [Eleusine coracana subsp. coracana]